METSYTKEEILAQQLQAAFEHLITEVVRKDTVFAFAPKEQVSSILLYAKEKLGYISLSHLSCVDWLESGELELVYIIWSPETKVNLFVKTRIDRENPVMENTDMIWRQINTYQREIREMFGVEFPGFIGEKEFILEDWEDAPPMRRDFDTLEYVNDTFFEREGREDKQDVRERIANRSGEEIPDFAKKYSRE
ncbi:MAG: NADH-quinone oxidoreductase subunit C [Bacteroidales bacterium]|nr:NADH-quinone oxidoreductase subunit C [Bacteroidales bacterium]RLD39078.1 MAG: NADH-quinone oxidoreductase subunit C [Bacteroidota bacterium]